MNFDQIPKKEKNPTEIIKDISRFNTDDYLKHNKETGYGEYDSNKFEKYIKENGLNIPNILDSGLEKLSLTNKFSDEEINYIEAFRAWLHCDFENSKKYISDKFKFECNTNEEFVKKYQFFNTVAYFIFEHEYTSYGNKEMEQRENSIFNILKKKTEENKGSFLLNYLSQDYVSVIEKKKNSIQEEKDLDWIPFKIAPKIFAFDSSESMFALVSKNNLNPNSLYVSDEKDFEKIESIIKSLNKPQDIRQEYFDKLVGYFSPLKTKDLILNPESKNINETELYLFRELHTKYHRLNIEEKTGISLSNIPLTEQRYFIDYLKFVDNNFLKEISDFNKKYKKDGFRTFLSIEHGGKEMGNKILKLGEKLPEDVAKKVFTKFGEIIDSVDEVVNVLGERFDKKTDNPLVMNSIRETLLKKGSDLLIECFKMTSKCTTEEECLEVSKTILERLENSKHSAILLGSAFKSTLKEGANLNEIKDVSLESTNDKTELNKYKNKMVKIFEDNRINYPKELLKETLNEFREAIEHPENKEFFILKDKENIIAFMRFDSLPNGNLYAGSLNSLNEIHGLAIGGALLKELLIKKSKDNNIKAVVYEKNPMLKKYTTDYGFKIVGEIENYKNTGQKFYKIEISKGSLKN